MCRSVCCFFFLFFFILINLILNLLHDDDLCLLEIEGLLLPLVDSCACSDAFVSNSAEMSPPLYYKEFIHCSCNSYCFSICGNKC